MHLDVSCVAWLHFESPTLRVTYARQSRKQGPGSARPSLSETFHVTLEITAMLSDTTEPIGIFYQCLLIPARTLFDSSGQKISSWEALHYQAILLDMGAIR